MDSELERVKRKMDLDALKRDLDNQIEFAKYGAKLARGYYMALIKEGFEKGEALHIICAHGILPKVQPSSNHSDD